MSLVHSNISIFVPHLGCPNNCSFCNQHHIARTSIIPDEKTVEDAVAVAKSSPRYNPATTEIAFFGGSFTAIEREYMLRLLSAAKHFVDAGDVFGIRVSTRPAAVDGEVLTLLRNYGVTTIELGAQSMSDEVLSMNERGHSAQDVRDASLLIKQFGFTLGLQMMTGLYGSDDETDIYTAREQISLSPDCVRIYPTITLKDTRLATLYNDGKYVPPSLQHATELCSEINEMFRKNGIAVIRLGLHTIDEKAYVAGPWHPAFKELCDAAVYRKAIEEKLLLKGKYDVFVCPTELSKAIGLKRSNIEYFKEKGFSLTVKPDDTLKKYDVLVKGCE